MSMLPVAVAAQLFPTRFQALARDLPSPVNVCSSQESHLRHIQRVLEQQQRQQERSAFGWLAAHALSLLAVPAALLSVLHGELQLWLRGAFLALLFTPAVTTAPLAAWAGGATRQAWLQLVCWTLERAGPAFIKWGQWSSTRPDLFPPDLCQAMERLQTAAPAHDAAHTRRAVLRALGRPPEALFESFEDQPVASGSIAQIHRATLSEEGAAATGGRYKRGATVAVKVRRLRAPPFAPPFGSPWDAAAAAAGLESQQCSLGAIMAQLLLPVGPGEGQAGAAARRGEQRGAWGRACCCCRCVTRA